MNVNVTTYCNLKCPYCFARDLWKAAGSTRNLSAAHLEKVLAFHRASGANEVRLIGGEPTLHPRFIERYSRVRDAGFKAVLFSNGIVRKEVVDFLARQPNLDSIVLNIQEPRRYTRAQRAALRYTLAAMGQRAVLSHVIYRMPFSLKFLIPMIQAYGLNKSIKVSIAAPCYKTRNACIPLKDHKRVIAEMVRQSKAFKPYGIRWYPDTTYMWCLFTPRQLRILRENVDFQLINYCSPVLEIAPDLTVFRCFGTAAITDPRIKMTDFLTEHQAYAHFKRQERGLKKAGIFAACLSCSMNGAECGAGCVAEIYRKIPLPERPRYLYWSHKNSVDKIPSVR